jgi:hypothetical protein
VVCPRSSVSVLGTRTGMEERRGLTIVAVTLPETGAVPCAGCKVGSGTCCIGLQKDKQKQPM